MSERELDLSPMELGISPTGEPSWLDRVMRLRDREDLGLFKLGYLEALLRIADWKGSKIETGQQRESEK
ncbi:hypothetical protein GWN63_03420 [Candidatus Bathyarchaeota archaeon]|nr:hypothetical protein [Candidatus Bathyarchaeota archaeon]NIU81279.1 hypothetical protein [Candidatus Bathyarchaeota archaeon]NIV67914.1 hypothetical protein [Candidatus Bathyarchaeota archaeon]NIW34497.1 hypothetical protein [Candidatus Bathyarchaeota archaeon]